MTATQPSFLRSPPLIRRPWGACVPCPGGSAVSTNAAAAGCAGSGNRKAAQGNGPGASSRHLLRLLPFFGLQTLLGIALASVVRGNHLLAAAGTWISNPFTYVPLYWFNYHVGDVLLRGGGAPPAAVTVNKASIWEQGWSFTSRLLLGSSLVGLVLSLGLGVLAWRLFRWQSRNDHRMRTGRHLEGHRSWPDMT